MNTQPLTDELIRSAIARRVSAAREGDLRERVLAATTSHQQRQGWRVRLDGEWLLPQRGLALRLSVALLLLVTLAVVAVLVGFRPFDDANPPRLGALAIVSGGDLYVAGPGGESPRLVWDLPASAHVASRELIWIDPETVLLTIDDEPAGIHVVNVTTRARRLLDQGWLLAISPDRHLALIPNGTPGGEKVIEIASGAVVGEIPVGIGGGPAAWSPDGRSIVGGTSDSISRVDIATSQRTLLVTGLCCGISEHTPTWSPDGSRVVYVNYHSPVDPTDCDFRCGTLWSVPAAGGAPTRISSELGSEILPLFSPDGRWIAYIDECPCMDAKSLGLVTDKLMIMAADGSGARVLAQDPHLRPTIDPAGNGPFPVHDSVPHGQFTWDPDSTGITYVSKVATLWHVTLGGVVTQLEGSAITEFARQVLP